MPLSHFAGVFTPEDLNVLNRVLERAFNDLLQTPDYVDREHLAAMLITLRQHGYMDEDDLYDALMERAQSRKTG